MKWEYEEIEYPSFEKPENILQKDSGLVKNTNSIQEDEVEGNKHSTMSRLERLRQDVLKRSVLRMIKRFYHRIFMKENQHLSKRRFKNVKFCEIHNSAK